MADRAQKIRAVGATAAATLALAIPTAVARAEVAAVAPTQGAALEEPAKPTTKPLAPGDFEHNETLVPPATDTPAQPNSAGGVAAEPAAAKAKKRRPAQKAKARSPRPTRGPC